MIAMLLAASGCGNGYQQGRLAVSGSQSRSLKGSDGELTIIRGDSLPLDPKSTGKQPLMYVLVILRETESTGSSSEGKNEKHLSEYTWSWYTPKKQLDVSLKWDRLADKVYVHGQTFDRSKGNAFVLICEPTSKVSAIQVGQISVGLDEAAALEAIQATMKSDPVVAGVSLQEIDFAIPAEFAE